MSCGFSGAGITVGFWVKCSFHWTVRQNLRVSQPRVKRSQAGVGEKLRPLSRTEISPSFKFVEERLSILLIICNDI